MAETDDPIWEGILNANMRAVDSIPLKDLPKWIEVIQSEEDPSNLPGYINHSFLFTEVKAGCDYLVAAHETKFVFVKFAEAKLDSGEENPNLMEE